MFVQVVIVVEQGPVHVGRDQTDVWLSGENWQLQRSLGYLGHPGIIPSRNVTNPWALNACSSAVRVSTDSGTEYGGLGTGLDPAAGLIFVSQRDPLRTPVDRGPCLPTWCEAPAP